MLPLGDLGDAVADAVGSVPTDMLDALFHGSSLFGLPSWLVVAIVLVLLASIFAGGRRRW